MPSALLATTRLPIASPEPDALALLLRIRLHSGQVQDDGVLVRIGARGHTGPEGDRLRGLLRDLECGGHLAAAGPRGLRLTEAGLDMADRAAG